ncbi:MAG: hypothetical protein RR201_02825 [Malacoplasma sp.]
MISSLVKLRVVGRPGLFFLVSSTDPFSLDFRLHDSEHFLILQIPKIFNGNPASSKILTSFLGPYSLKNNSLNSNWYVIPLFEICLTYLFFLRNATCVSVK